MQIEFVETTTKHLRDLDKNLRQKDKEELEKLGKPLTIMFRAFKSATFKKTCLIDGEVAAIFGVSGSLLGTTGFPYFITSNVSTKVSPLKFYRIYKEGFDLIKTFFPALEVYVDADYPEAVHLAELVGFKCDGPEEINNYLFYKLTFKNPKYLEPPQPKFRLETIRSCASDIMKLAHRHGEEFTYHKDIKGEVDPDWEKALVLEKLGHFFIVTVRIGAELIGYFMFGVTNLPHYKTVKCAYEDTFYLVPEYRGTKLGYKFLKYSIECMKNTDAKVLKVANKTKADYAKIWERLGFEHEENVYTMVIN